MENMQTKIKIWSKLIQSEKLEDVIENIQMNLDLRLDDKHNRNIFKLLLYLSHTADKYYNKQDYKDIGKKIAELTRVLCSLLIKVPDANNYVISLYHIIRCLISLSLYKDAASICCHLEPKDLYAPQNGTIDVLVKISSLWHNPINNIYMILNTETLNTANYNQLKNLIKYEVEMIRITYKNYTKHLIIRLNTYLDKIAIINKEINTYFDDFCKYVMDCLEEAQLYFDEADKYVIYCHILRIICRIVSRIINTTLIQRTVKILNQLFNYFMSLLLRDEECCQCFQQFQDLCIIFLVPVENFVSDHAKDMRNVIDFNLKIVEKYGYTGALKWNALSISELIETLFTSWEIYIKIYKQFLDSGILLETMNLVIHVSTLFTKQVLNKCRSCLNEDCTIKNDVYNAVATKCRCINLLCKFPTKTLSKDVCVLARRILEQTVVLIHEMREYKCKQWTQLWSTCGILIYNMGIVSEHVYEESAYLFSLLCTCIFQFDETESGFKCLAFENPISSVLHRLSAIHYTNGIYREAMTASALNALLSYNQPNTKAFSMWVNIKKKCTVEENTKLSMLECLKNDKEKISKIGLSIDISNYDLIQLCLREARSLLEEKITFTNGVSAVIDELKKLKPNDHQYAQVIQLLGHYLLGSDHDSSVLEYYKLTISDLKLNGLNSMAVLCLEANLSFFMFVEELHIMNKQTHTEIENTKFALYAPKLPELLETKSPNVVPAYTMINIKKVSSLMLNMQNSLKKWSQLFTRDMNIVVKNWEPSLILRILITAGEYSRLYRYEDCEAEAWLLVYRLASEIDDHCAILYVTGRSISLRQINYDWIATATKFAEKYKDSKDECVIYAIAIFWISLADFYFECGKCNDAKKLLIEARNLPGISFLSNTSIHLLSLDTIIRNYNLYNDNMQHEEYGSYIAESLYAMVNLNQDLSMKKWKNQTEYLFSYDVLFNTTVNLSTRVNSLLSFREISAHLVRRVTTAQSLGAVMRTAELLKSLCYIDLSRSKLDDCEVKLQGLEHILDIETFQLSINFQTSTRLAVTPTRVADSFRDLSQQNSSPLLGKKLFDLPKFALNTDCNCYKCCNLSYQYLVFVTIYIRAQLYALQNHFTIAFEYFHGAFKIKQKLFGKEATFSPKAPFTEKVNVKQRFWQDQFYITDYVRLLIDFCYFLKLDTTSRQENVFEITNLIINICREYRLEGHPIYMTAKELILNNYFQEISKSLEFMVPQSYNIDISNYVKVSDHNVCVTPLVSNCPPKQRTSIRRRRSPIALKLTEGSTSLNGDDADRNTPSLLPVYSTIQLFKSNIISVRRRILDDDLSDRDTDDPVLEDTKSRNNNDDNNIQIEERSIRDIMVKVALLIPDISQNLMDLVDKTYLPATFENIDKLIKKVEQLKISSTTNIRRKRIKNIRQLTTIDYNRGLNQAIELLKEIAINEKTITLIKTEKLNILQEQNTSEINDEKNSIRNTGILKKNTEYLNISSVNEVKTVRNRSTKSVVSNETCNTKTTRSSLRKSKKQF